MRAKLSANQGRQRSMDTQWTRIARYSADPQRPAAQPCADECEAAKMCTVLRIAEPPRRFVGDLSAMKVQRRCVR